MLQKEALHAFIKEETDLLLRTAQDMHESLFPQATCLYCEVKHLNTKIDAHIHSYETVMARAAEFDRDEIAVYQKVVNLFDEDICLFDPNWPLLS